MKLNELRAAIRAEPRQLYWRWRLLSCPQPRGVSRRMLFESLMMVARAAPKLVVAPKLRDWSLSEAQQWVSLLKGQDREETSLRRASAYAQLPMTKKHAAAALKLARAEFDGLPLKSKQEHVQLWAKLLLKTDPAEFDRSIELILEGLQRSSQWGGTYFANFWSLDRKLSAATRDRLGRFIDEQPDEKVDAHVRVSRAEQRGLVALKSKDLAQAGLALAEMAKWAAFDRFPGNFMKLVDSAAKRGVLREERLAFLTVVLTREWRDWVRPGVEKRAAEIR